MGSLFPNMGKIGVNGPATFTFISQKDSLCHSIGAGPPDSGVLCNNMTGFTQWGREKFKLKKQCFLLQLAKVKSLGHCKIFKESGIFWAKSKNSFLAQDVEHDQWKKCTLTYRLEKKSTLVCSRDTTTTPSQRPLMNQTKFGLNFTRTKRAKNQLERER